MLLEEKIQLMKDGKYLKNKLLKYYFFLLFSIFLFVLNFYLTLILYEKSIPMFKSFDLSKIDKYQKSYVLIWIFMIIFGYLEINWFINSLSSILLNRYFEFNIFRSLKWFKVKLFTLFKFSLFKQIKQKIEENNMESKDFINYMQNNNFILHSSQAISFKYSDFWRKTNDLDFISKDLNSKLKNIDKYKNIKINFIDDITAKLELEQTKIEVLIAKYIPNKYISKINGIKIPNIKWMIAMKIHQLFRLYLMNKNEISISKNKIQNTLLDLAFLLNKSNSWKMNKTIHAIANLYLSNFFISYYINTYCFNLTNKEDNQNLLKYLKNKIQENKMTNELLFFFDELLNKLNNEKTIQIMSNKINEIVKNKEELEIKFIETSTNENKEISTLKRLFLTKLEKENFLKNQYKNSNIKNKYITFLLKDFEKINEKDNELDIRKILLLELNKQIEEVKNK
ncbi:MAG: MAG4530 family protein [Metamycoplasmataceae bacterium]